MTFFKKDNHNENVISRLQETELYELVMEEINNDDLVPGIWGQAIVEADGDDKKALAKYIKLRVQSLKDGMFLGKVINEQIRRVNSLDRLNNLKSKKIEKNEKKNILVRWNEFQNKR